MFYILADESLTKGCVRRQGKKKSCHFGGDLDFRMI